MVLIDNANATNPCCEHVHLVEENAKLKTQLEKGLVSGIQGKKNLNDLLSNQKEVVAKEGVGFSPKNKKKNDKTKRPPPLMQTFVREGESAPEEKKKNNVKKGNAIPPNKAGDFNPSYVLCRASDGHVYAKFVGSLHEYIEWSIWVPKTLVTNIKGPITKWVPKTKH